MKWILAGLGNPGEEYVGTRHNVGRELLMALEKKLPKNTTLVLPDTYMNNSGKALQKLVPSKKAAAQLVVVHDELDLPLGRIKISFGASAGGHNGVKSVQAAIKTNDFVRIRVGISPSTASGKLKRPDAEKIVDFVLGKFRPAEKEKLKKVQKVVAEAIDLIASDGVDRAIMEIHSKQ